MLWLQNVTDLLYKSKSERVEEMYYVIYLHYDVYKLYFQLVLSFFTELIKSCLPKMAVSQSCG